MNIQKVLEILKNPKQLPVKLNYRYPLLLRWMNDEQCLKFWYWYYFNKKLDLKNPMTFNEKLQWLKLYDRKPEYTAMVDKYQAKQFVADKIGQQYVIPTLGVWDKFEDIDFSILPDRFVLKCTHDSGGLVICRDKRKLNWNKARKRIKGSLKRNFYWVGREWPYKDVKPQILAETYMEDNTENCGGLTDYKFYCFNGVPKFLYISKGLDNHSTATISFVTLDWEMATFERADFRPFSELPPKPETFDEMIKICKKLSQGYKFLRVDLYQINGKVYFSELTFSPCSGFMPFKPECLDKELGEWIVL